MLPTSSRRATSSAATRSAERRSMERPSGATETSSQIVAPEASRSRSGPRARSKTTPVSSA
jgi:hypothetical protein